MVDWFTSHFRQVEADLEAARRQMELELAELEAQRQKKLAEEQR